MKMRYAVALGLVLALASSLSAETGSPAIGVSAVIGSQGSDPASRVFTYRYRVSNPRASGGAIGTVEIPVTRGPYVPGGIAAPEGWLSHLGGGPGVLRWTASDPPSQIVAGQDVDGFHFSSTALPSIGVIEFRGDFVARTRTLGPKAPPTPFVPIEFLNDMLAALDASRQLGWITSRGAHLSLLEKLSETKRRLAADDSAAARNALEAFLDEVRAASCHDFHCRGTEPLTSEGFALLFFNGEFLLERLPIRAPGVV